MLQGLAHFPAQAYAVISAYIAPTHQHYDDEDRPIDYSFRAGYAHSTPLV